MKEKDTRLGYNQLKTDSLNVVPPPFLHLQEKKKVHWGKILWRTCNTNKGDEYKVNGLQLV